MNIKSIPNSLTTIAKSSYNLNEEKVEIYSHILDIMSVNNLHSLIKEANYLISIGNNPNEVFLDLLERNACFNDLLDNFIKDKLEIFSEQDLYERFFI